MTVATPHNNPKVKHQEISGTNSVEIYLPCNNCTSLNWSNAYQSQLALKGNCNGGQDCYHGLTHFAGPTTRLFAVAMMTRAMSNPNAIFVIITA